MATNAVSTKAGGYTKRLILLGASGYVGHHVGQLAAARGWSVVACSRHGMPRRYHIQHGGGSWIETAQWVSIDACSRSEVFQFLNDFAGGDAKTTAIINCIGALSLDHTYARRVNGDPHLNLVSALYDYYFEEAAEGREGAPDDRSCINRPLFVRNLVFVSAADSLAGQRIFHGYYYGKRQAEKAMLTYLSPPTTPGGQKSPVRATILRPSFIYGNRVLEDETTLSTVAPLPLWLVGAPAELALRPLHALMPRLAPTPPISVEILAQAAVAAIEDKYIALDQPNCSSDNNNVDPVASKYDTKKVIYEYEDIIKLARTI